MARNSTTPAANKPAAKKPTRKTAAKPARPKGLAHGRWLGDFPNLSPAEKRLVECCARGDAWEPEGWDGDRPESASNANTIRAELIRFLVLGGDEAHPVHNEGVMVWGAWVAGTLDLHQCNASVRPDLRSCHFEAAPIFSAARLPELALSGCKVPGLRGDRIKVEGGVFLIEGFAATGEVRLLGGEIGGNLACRNGTFSVSTGAALSADGIKVAGDVFLDRGFAATGEVRLLGAEIGGDFTCSNGTFNAPGGHALHADRIKVAGGVFLRDGFASTGEVRFLGAEIGGDLSCRDGVFANVGGYALSADGINVKGCVFLRGAQFQGAISFPSAHIGTLADDDACWAAGEHYLDGLHYDNIFGKTDADSRIRWLEYQRLDQLNGESWAPQPWEQLVKVLRNMGHPLEATKVAIAKQERMRRAGKVGGRFAQLLHWLYGFLAGYGYRPLRTVRAMLAVWLLAATAFYFGGQSGYIGPTTPLYNSPALSGRVEQLCGHGGESGKTPWTRCPAMPAEYTTFQPLMYSLDLILPLVDLQQESDWAPIVEDPPGNTLWPGTLLRWLMWFEILFGWAMSLMLVAVLGKLVNKD